MSLGHGFHSTCVYPLGGDPQAFSSNSLALKQVDIRPFYAHDIPELTIPHKYPVSIQAMRWCLDWRRFVFYDVWEVVIWSWARRDGQLARPYAIVSFAYSIDTRRVQPPTMRFSGQGLL